MYTGCGGVGVGVVACVLCEACQVSNDVITTPIYVHTYIRTYVYYYVNHPKVLAQLAD